MHRSMAMAFIFVLVLAAGEAFAGNCNNDNFPGTYTRIDAPLDPIGNGELHQHVFTLTLGADGTARQEWTGLPDYMINTGSGTANLGSWKCRSDGKLVVTLLNATFGPVGPDPSLGTVDDLSLFSHTRTTILFNVNNPNKLKRTLARSRVYARDQNPADPNGGTLLPLNTTQIVYNRFVASDADLLAP